MHVFSHWIHPKTFFHVVIDLVFPIACVLLTVVTVGLGGGERVYIIVSYAVIFAVAMVFFNRWMGLYSRNGRRTLTQTRARAVLSLYLSIPLAFCVFSVFSITESSQNLLLVSSLAALFVTLVHRVYSIHTNTGSMLANRILIFGTGPAAKSVGKVIKDSSSDVYIVGYYPSSMDAKYSVQETLVLQADRSLSDTARAMNVQEIIIAVHERRGGILPLRELLDCKLSGVTVLDLASYFERALGQIRLDSLRVGWLIFGGGFRQGWSRRLVKRCFDIVAASILILLALPVMFLTALLIVWEDGFPIFYRQERVGLNGRLFDVIKFRSMGKNAESDGKPRWATANDDRTTRVGRIIRKMRIDELPQLISVLKGDMSLVGPRPERPFFVDSLTREIPFYAVRHSVKPGVTGWAQVNYHYGASVDDSRQKLQYDLYYVKNNTLFLDLVILFETVGVVLTGKGAQ